MCVCARVHKGWLYKCINQRPLFEGFLPQTVRRPSVHCIWDAQKTEQRKTNGRVLIEFSFVPLRPVDRGSDSWTNIKLSLKAEKTHNSNSHFLKMTLRCVLFIQYVRCFLSSCCVLCFNLASGASATFSLQFPAMPFPLRSCLQKQAKMVFFAVGTVYSAQPLSFSCVTVWSVYEGVRETNIFFLSFFFLTAPVLFHDSSSCLLCIFLHR